DWDLVLKIFPRLALPNADLHTFKSQDLISPCERCRTKKRDTFQVVGPDPTVPSPQRLFFSTGEIRIFFKICCPPSHHASTDENNGYIITFELHHGKRILMSQTIKNAGPGMVPEPVAMDNLPSLSRPVKRKMSLPPTSLDAADPFAQAENGSIPRKRSTVMSLMNLISDEPPSPGTISSAATADPSSPTTAVVPLSPDSYQNERDELNARERNKSLSYDDQAPSSWSYGKEPKPESGRVEVARSKPASSVASTSTASTANTSNTTAVTANTKPIKKRQEPHELSELGIGQRASANLHAAYVNGQLRERSKAGLPTDGLVDIAPKSKPASNKPKPSHACPEPDCDKSFSRLFNLRSHMRTHSKARPFVCESCNFAFSRRHDRDRHAKKHLSEKPYKCIVCEATFVRQDALVRHLRMDGVQNQCMAAMEQRSMLMSNSENNNNYMIAAKQQVQDEQQNGSENGSNEKKRSAKRQQSKDSSDQDDAASEDDEEADNGEHVEKDDDDDDGEKDVEEEDLEPKGRTSPKFTKSIEKASVSRTELAQKKTISKDDGGKHAMAIKGEHLSERQVQVSQPPTPPQERTGAHDAGIIEKDVIYDPSKQASYPMAMRYEKGFGPQDFYAEDRYGSTTHSSHPRSFYPSPLRSHSRSHSQSQPYPEYHSPNHHDLVPSAYPPPPLVYHGSQSKYQPHGQHGHHYRDIPQSYGYSGPHSSRYHERAPNHEGRGHPLYGDHSHHIDQYGPYPARDSTTDSAGEGHSMGSQLWVSGAAQDMHTDLSELEPDKSILEAAMGLLRIRASQW
ncbi:hypothetical protein BX616_004758, partial [Lobosporangium transversale]